MSTDTKNEIQKPTQKPMTIRTLLSQDSVRDQIARALPAHITPDRFMRVALTALARTPKLNQCTTDSLMRCLMDLSALGLEPDGRRAHLIPFENRKAGTVECTLIIDYKGLVELVRRSGDVSSIHADVVCEHDEFEVDRGRVVRHVVNYRKPRGDVFAAYALVTLKDGTEQAEVMTREEVEKIRMRSKSANSGSWVTDWNEMAKKTVFRRLSKWLTLSPEIRDLIDTDDQHSGIIEATAARIEHASGNARLLSTLTANTTETTAEEPVDDGGPTADDIAGTVDHGPAKTTLFE